MVCGGDFIIYDSFIAAGSQHFSSSVNLIIAMKTIEFRIPLPLSLDEYQIAQCWAFIEQSKLETGGGEGVRILKDEPSYSKGGQGHTLNFEGERNEIPVIFHVVGTYY